MNHREWQACWSSAELSPGRNPLACVPAAPFAVTSTRYVPFGTPSPLSLWAYQSSGFVPASQSFAWQMHAGTVMEVRFKHIEIQHDP